MMFLVKVRVDIKTMAEFGKKLQSNELDRTGIKSETYCVKDDPSVGYTVWEAATKDAFEKIFAPWRKYYEEIEIIEVVLPEEAMRMIISSTY